ncbi:single-stranded DNA-binding protein [Pseudanabaena sp. FACHB-1277]|uniref:Single-stranded DNA-binding protein n=1 Tax=Pseudanabaena cinerea FACHB-1277 TaxID=2949581 RepID=A0A926UWV7_9CYAN|nr:single-stranded DNA-binding protein [Pseudanabaena cinerea]MBD2152717.1 single-stranded DNA-binding protein [Pseudanabaena cinerea FACHB-1277]
MTWATAHICGYLAAKPELKQFEETGTVVCNLVLYVNRRKNAEDKEVKELEPLKIHAEVWGKQAVNCVNILDKGWNPTITGTLDEVSFLGKDGKQIRLTVVRYAQVLDYGKAPTEKVVDIPDESQKVVNELNPPTSKDKKANKPPKSTSLTAKNTPEA